MASWHPVDNLVPSSWVYRISGVTEPFAEIRYLPVLDGDGFAVWRFRVVTWLEPRRSNGWRLSHADDSRETARVFALGAFDTPEAAVEAL